MKSTLKMRIYLTLTTIKSKMLDILAAASTNLNKTKNKKKQLAQLAQLLKNNATINLLHLQLPTQHPGHVLLNFFINTIHNNNV